MTNGFTDIAAHPFMGCFTGIMPSPDEDKIRELQAQIYELKKQVERLRGQRETMFDGMALFNEKLKSLQ